MNIHQKLAIGFAPFLLIGGWVIADYWDNAKKKKKQVHMITPQDTCDISGNNCELSFPTLTLKLQSEDTVDGRIYRAMSSHDLEGLLFSIGDLDLREPFRMQSIENPRQWQVFVPTTEVPRSASYPMRVASRNSDGKHVAEFTAR